MSDPTTETTRVLRRVRQTRDFVPTPIADDVLADILDVGRWTGSASNKQPWTFLVVRERATLERLGELNPGAPWLRGAGAAIIVVIAPAEPAAPERDQYDDGRLAERLLAATVANGLAGAIGWFRATDGDAETRALLGIPAGLRMRTVIGIGVPTPAGAAPKAAPGTARKPLAEIVRHERW